jgi:hypothetical protein
MNDRYTKFVLTIIAACRVWNVFSGFSNHPAQAQYQPPAHVILDGWGQFKADRPLPVRVLQ